MAHQRYFNYLKQLNRDIKTPVQTEPLSYALTRLYQKLPEASDTLLKRRAVAVRDAFLLASGRRVRTDAQSKLRRCQTTLAALYGVVPVFPWTTAADLAASVKKLRMRGRTRQNHAAVSSQTIHRDAVTDALTLFLNAIVEQDHATLRRTAHTVCGTLLQPDAS